MTQKEKMFNLMVRRKAAGLTQQQLANAVGVIKNTISAYETGQRFPRRDTLDKLAAALNCEPKDLI